MGAGGRSAMLNPITNKNNQKKKGKKRRTLRIPPHGLPMPFITMFILIVLPSFKMHNFPKILHLV